MAGRLGGINDRERIRRRGVVRIQGMSELMNQFNNLGIRFPKSALRDISKKAIQGPLMEAKHNAPLGYTGELEEGIIAIEENNDPGRSVRQIVMDRSKNNVFQKPIPDPKAENPQGAGTRGGERPHGYYPWSVEYGFMRSPGKKTQGQYFILRAAKKHRPKVRKLVNKEMGKVIDRLTR
jgi:hypothetical protein